MFRIILEKQSSNFFKKLNKKDQIRISEKLELLKENPQLGVPLTAALAGLWKLRVGDYRLIYQIQNSELKIIVIKIGHRKNIY